MKIRMSRMYVDGVETSKREFLERHDYQTKGILLLADTSNQGLNKLTKLATFQNTRPGSTTDTLHDPVLTWVNEERFVLVGYERKIIDGKTIRFAQSWLCRVGWENAVPTS
jgi:hypothetical protein